MMDAESLPEIRKKLHQIAELSEHEEQTSEFIVSYLKRCNPSRIIEHVGGYGVLCVFDFDSTGPCIVLRAELDGLPISEKSNQPYRSTHPGVSHSCGHDGHMSILLGLATFLSTKPANMNGRVVLLFQPAEETAVGAKKVMEDERFHKLNPTHIFGLHNIPLNPLGEIIVKKGVFASASQGLIIRIHGISSHAGHPDQGVSPLQGMLDCVKILTEISDSYSHNNPDSFITIIHMKLGKRAFGTSPGEGLVMATFRSFNQQIIDEMAALAIKRLEESFSSFQGSWDHEWVEVFPSIVNHPDCVDAITSAANSLGFCYNEINEPFSWSEDFSYYLQRYKGAFFCVGSGENQHVLHHPSYDFPDDLIEQGVKIFQQILYETQIRYKKGIG